MKKLVLATALGALMIAPAIAQSSPPAGVAADRTPHTQAAQTRGVIPSQAPDQWLASKFNGTDVIGADNQKIGDVTDVLFDRNGQISAYIIGVGGFLNVGVKDVALAPSSFEVIKGQNGEADKLKLSMTKDQLKDAQTFARYEPQRSTTGAGVPDRGPGIGTGVRQ